MRRRGLLEEKRTAATLGSAWVLVEDQLATLMAEANAVAKDARSGAVAAVTVAQISQISQYPPCSRCPRPHCFAP